MKQCSYCFKYKPESEFTYSKQSKDKLYSHCKVCCAEKMKDYREKNKERIRYKKKDAHIRDKESNCKVIIKKLNSSRQKAVDRNHKSCKESKQELIKRFSKYCNSCGKFIGASIHLDHCHKTGKFRGFICQNCNLIIGYAQENIQNLLYVIEYLKSNSEISSP